MSDIQPLKFLKCTRCKYEWAVRGNLPMTCANQKCRSPYWDKEYVIAPEKRKPRKQAGPGQKNSTPDPRKVPVVSTRTAAVERRKKKTVEEAIDQGLNPDPGEIAKFLATGVPEDGSDWITGIDLASCPDETVVSTINAETGELVSVETWNPKPVLNKEVTAGVREIDRIENLRAEVVESEVEIRERKLEPTGDEFPDYGESQVRGGRRKK